MFTDLKSPKILPFPDLELWQDFFFNLFAILHSE